MLLRASLQFTVSISSGFRLWEGTRWAAVGLLFNHQSQSLSVAPRAAGGAWAVIGRVGMWIAVGPYPDFFMGPSFRAILMAHGLVYRYRLFSGTCLGLLVRLLLTPGALMTGRCQSSIIRQARWSETSCYGSKSLRTCSFHYSYSGCHMSYGYSSYKSLM